MPKFHLKLDPGLQFFSCSFVMSFVSTTQARLHQGHTFLGRWIIEHTIPPENCQDMTPNS